MATPPQASHTRVRKRLARIQIPAAKKPPHPGASPGRGTGARCAPQGIAGDAVSPMSCRAHPATTHSHTPHQKIPLALTQPGEGDYVPMTRKVLTCPPYTPTHSRRSPRSQASQNPRSTSKPARDAAQSSNPYAPAAARYFHAITSTNFSESRRQQHEPS